MQTYLSLRSRLPPGSLQRPPSAFQPETPSRSYQGVPRCKPRKLLRLQPEARECRRLGFRTEGQLDHSSTSKSVTDIAIDCKLAPTLFVFRDKPKSVNGEVFFLSRILKGWSLCPQTLNSKAANKTNVLRWHNPPKPLHSFSMRSPIYGCQPPSASVK